MTPLEEIEQAIDYHSEESDEYRRIQILGPLYIARAIERLEATVRAIGILLQYEADERRDRGPQFVRTWKDPHAYAPFEIGDSAARCRCGQPRVDPIHPAEL